MKRGDRASIPVTTWRKIFIDVYACANCGFTEEYVAENDLNEIKKNWEKMNN